MNQRTAKALDSLAGATVIAIRQLGFSANELGVTVREIIPWASINKSTP